MYRKYNDLDSYNDRVKIRSYEEVHIHILEGIIGALNNINNSIIDLYE